MHTDVHHRAHAPPSSLYIIDTYSFGGGGAGGARVPERSRDWLRALPLRQPTRSHFLCPPFLFQSERGGEWMFPARASAAAPACSAPPVLDLQCLQETE